MGALRLKILMGCRNKAVLSQDDLVMGSFIKFFFLLLLFDTVSLAPGFGLA